ncbi:hypothetical protein [Luxibacter massiliensis]|uniref:hypothetical protein n=1 Tax=Luxibacter massiliensis TaxID=2219695 RepID=UPI0013E0E5AA|nr:hypothetical protein [Luxibacter massiliensis]
MQNRIFEILKYISLHTDNDIEFYEALPKMTQEEILALYLRQAEGTHAAASRD